MRRDTASIKSKKGFDLTAAVRALFSARQKGEPSDAVVLPGPRKAPAPAVDAAAPELPRLLNHQISMLFNVGAMFPAPPAESDPGDAESQHSEGTASPETAISLEIEKDILDTASAETAAVAAVIHSPFCPLAESYAWDGPCALCSALAAAPDVDLAPSKPRKEEIDETLASYGLSYGLKQEDLSSGSISWDSLSTAF